MYIQLDYAKKHLNIEEDFTEDDEYILGLIEVAESAVRVHINEDFASIAEKNGGCFLNAYCMRDTALGPRLHQSQSPDVSFPSGCLYAVLCDGLHTFCR